VASRRERVILDLEDHFTPGIAKATTATALFKRELNSLSGDAVRTRRSVSGDIDKPIQDVGRSSNASSREVDRLSGRMRILADVAAILGPSLIPIAAVGVPAIAGLASQLGFAAVAGGTAILAFQGVGDALKALNDYQLSPTEAHLKALQDKMSALGPAGRDFVRELQRLRPVLQDLQNVAQAGLFPGVTEGLKAMETALPRVEAVVAAVSKELGNIAADTGKSLASDRWTPFLDFIAREAPSALHDMAAAAGNTIHALAELWMAFDPLNDDFSHWLVRATEDLDQWASGLSKTDGFREFVDYIETNGPQVADTFGAIANAVIQIVEAAAPLGGPVLHGIEVLANLVAAIADSDLGTPIFTAVAALSLLNRAIAITGSLQGKTFGGPAVAQMRGYGTGLRALSADWAAYTAVQNSAAGRARASVAAMDAQAAASGRLGGRLRTLGKGAGVLAGIGIAATGAADGIGLTNTASLALMGTLVPGGAVIGAATGAVLDLWHANDGLEGAIKRVNAAAQAGDFATMRAGIADLRREIDDLNSTNGVGDFLSDALKKTGDALQHPGFSFGTTHGETEAKKAIANAEAVIEASREGSYATDAYGQVVATTGREAQTTAARIRGMVDAMRAQRDEALSAFDAETRYRQALKDAAKQAKESNAGIKGSSDAALKNRELIGQLASAWNNQSDAVKNNVGRFKEAKANFIETATAMGVPIDQAKRLAKHMLEIPEKRVIDVQANTGDADAKIQGIINGLARIHDKHITITATTNANVAEAAQADGGTVRGQRYPYGDKVLTMLAPGEEVITNRHGEADRFRADRAAGRIPAYADGGRVAGGSVAAMAGLSDRDIARLAAAITGDRLMNYRDSRDAHLSALRTAFQEVPMQRASDDAAMLGLMS
jgi:hypothetical protein